jgi:hypothetical protein
MPAGKRYDQILTAAAKEALTPLGFWRKGRSRLWLADNGFWLNVVGFRPSPWAAFVKSSDLDVSAHWLWGLNDFISLDEFQGDIRSYIEFETPEQFEPLATKQAADAVGGSRRLRARFSTIGTAATDLISRAESFLRERGSTGWPAYNAAVAAGICGDPATAGSLFEVVLENFEGSRVGEMFGPAIKRMRAEVKDTTAFRSMLENQVNARRVALGLEPRTNVFGL